MFLTMEYLILIWTVTLIHLLAVVIPGPDFIVAVKNSISYWRKTWFWTAIWFGLWISVHIFYCIAWLALIISKSILAFNIIKLLGAIYLIYIGIKSIFAKSSQIEIGETQQKTNISSIEALKIGFLTNVLNPKATLFFLSLFTIVISPGTPLYILVILSIIMIINTAIWFSLVAIFFTQKKLINTFDKIQWIFNKVLWWLLISLGIKIALTQK